MTIPAVFKFINWITGTPVPIDDAMVSALTAPVDPALEAALSSYIVANNPDPPTKENGVLTPHENLIVLWASNSTVTIKADAVIVYNVSGVGQRLVLPQTTLNMANSGVNGLDIGAEAANTWYYIWAIAKDDGTIAGLLSVSSTAPTMPTDYTYKGIIGAVRNNAASNFIGFTQRGKVTQANNITVLTGGTSTVYAAVSLSATIPVNATRADFMIQPISTAGTTLVTALISPDGDIGTTTQNSGFQRVSNLVDPNGFIAYGFIPIKITQQVDYYVAGAAPALNLIVCGWSF